ncbi:uncharacterized protein [Penaeus vannamei]|uniref:uncharacterized protein n=1 Tax=Penaeus vannamei TaxID=6689 RepID=UPI00387F73A2
MGRQRRQQLTAAGGTPISGQGTKSASVKLVICCWNVRTLLDRTDSGYPERKTALVDRELARYGIDIAALSETRLTGHGNLTEQNYTFYWSGGVSHQAGVAFAIQNGLRLESFPEGISNRLMKLGLPLSSKCQLTLLSVYALTMTHYITSKTNFYVSLGQALNVPRTDKLLILGDFNARVGRDSETWGCVLGQHGRGKCNSNGNMLLELCTEHDLVITNTFFKTPDKCYNSWCHPRSKQWHLLVYVLVRRDDLKDICSTHVMRGADCDTDHLLNNLTTINKLAAKVTEAIFGLPIQAKAVSSDAHWNNLRKAVYSAAKETLGHPQRHHQDWFEDNEEIHNLLAEVPQRRQRNSKAFFDGLKGVYGPRQSGSNPVLSADGSQLHYTPSDILSRWWEHFQGLLNRPSTVDNSAISRLNQHPIRSDLGIPPTEAELTLALKLLSNGKAPGADGIPAEVFKKGGHALHHKLLVLFQTYWEAGNLPQDFRDATIITLFKQKGDRRDCGNHRGISLLSIAGKILAEIVLMRLHKISEDVLPESQSGFRQGRGSVDMIFAFRQLQEKAMEQNVPLYAVFVDFMKAFDTVDRDTLCGNNSDAFEVLHGVKQGCVLAPTFFAMYLAAMLENMPSNLNKGIFIRTRTDGGLFNLSRLRSHWKILMQCIRELLYADDSALVAHLLKDIQEIMDGFAKSAEFGLTINAQKTEVLYQPPPG